jgi:lipopolysaccharide export LptBFGC system permease protein LptF
MAKLFLACLVAPLTVAVLLFWAAKSMIPNGQDVDRIRFVAKQLKSNLVENNLNPEVVWQIQPGIGGGVIFIKGKLDQQEIEKIKFAFNKIEQRSGIDIEIDSSPIAVTPRSAKSWR